MRVIGGCRGGIRLAGFTGDRIRPTSDKVKGAVFSILDNLVPDYDTFADLFAGTGGMGIEALSRGAENVYFFDRDPKSLAVVRENLKRTGFSDSAEVNRMPARRGLDMLAADEVRCDVIFMDPPYRDVVDSLSLFDEIERAQLLAADGVIVLEHDKSDIIPNKVSAFMKIKEKMYGNTVISFFRRGEK